MTITVGSISKVQGLYRVSVTMTAPVGPIVLTVDGARAWGGDGFAFRFRNSRFKKTATGWDFALKDENDTLSISSTITAASAPNTGLGWIPLPLHGWRECTAAGDVGNIVANGGVLASDTTPTMTGDANDAQCITWAAGNADPVCCQVPLPPNFDGADDVLVDFDILSGTTNAATMTIGSSWDGGALVTDTADDSATKSATAHRITATIAAADVPDGAKYLTLILTPPTHGTDAITLYNTGIRFQH